MNKYVISIFAAMYMAISTSAYSAPEIKPGFIPVRLEEFTTLQLDIMPHAGTQLIFPFELDNPFLKPALKIRLTNGKGFQVPSDDNALDTYVSGKNTITIVGKANEKNAVLLGNLFINVGGYNISIALRTTYHVSKHSPNIVFEEDDEARNHMVESMVRERTKYYEEKLAKIKEDNEKSLDDSSLIHLAKVARMKKKIVKFKEEGSITLNGNRIVVFADQIQSYGDLYHSFLFELENKSSNDFRISGIDIIVYNEGGEHSLLGSMDCADRIESGQNTKCVFTTSKGILKDNGKMKIVLKTDRGVGEFSW